MRKKLKIVSVLIFGWVLLLDLNTSLAQTTLDISASSDDGFVSDAAIVIADNPYTIGSLKMGSSDVNGNTNLTSGILPFELPAIPEGEEITDANLNVYVSFGRQWANCNIDLYGLAYQAASTISSTDHFVGDFGAGKGSDTGIQDDYFTKNVALGGLDSERNENTDATGDANLVSYLKAQYNAGAVAGDFVFLRLSVDNTGMTGSQYFNIHDATDSNPAVLSITHASTSNVAPILAAIGNQQVETNENLIINISTSDANGDNLTITTTNNLPPSAAFLDNEDGTATITVTNAGAIATYSDIVVTASDGEFSDTETISIDIIAQVANQPPVLAAMDNEQVNQYGYLKIDLSATDADSDPLTFSTTNNLPASATLVDNGDGTGYIEIVSEASVTVYPDIVVTVGDGNDADTETISISVVARDANQLMNLDSPTGSRFAVTDKVWPANHGEADVSYWNDDKVGVATITIDDNIEADHSWWLDMQTTYADLKFTWFVIENSVTAWNKYQTLATAGNEVQGHDDCDINDGSDIGYREALESIRDQINSNTTSTAQTYAYPCGIETKVNIARDIFIGMRGVEGIMNKADEIDYLALNSRSAQIDNHDIDVLLDKNELLFNISYYRGWYSTHYHSVSDKTATESHLNYINSKSSEVWIAGFTEAMQYGQERDSHSLIVDDVADLSVKFTLTDNMMDAAFDFPLTVKVRVNNNWLSATAVQNGLGIDLNLMEHEGNKYALVRAVPDQGQVTITGALTEAANTAPVLQAIGNQTLSEAESLTVQLSAIDIDGDPLTFSVSEQLPPFATFVDHQDGTATLSINPSVGDVGLLENITFTVSDGTYQDAESISINVTTFAGAVRYCDPVNGSNANDGSEGSPWGSFSSVLSANKTINDGDLIYLMSGEHGTPTISGKIFTEGVLVKTLAGHDPNITNLILINSQHLVFDDITIDGSTASLSKEGFLVTGDVNTSQITFKNCLIQSAAESSSWTQADWYSNSMGGMDMRGTNIVVENTTIRNTYHALSLRGANSRASYNLIDNFAGDGMRGLGDFSVFEYNTIRDCYVEDYATNHDDAFQTFILTEDPKSEGMIIRSNKILLFEDPITQFVLDNNLIGESMQGIIITDGYADGWVVENNLLVTNHFHGISLYGVRNSRVQNNTVVKHPYFTDVDQIPWILLDDNGKTGQANLDNIIRNNLTGKLRTELFDATSTVEGNVVIDPSNSNNYTSYFKDYLGYDYHLKEGSPAVEAGVNSDLSTFDLEGQNRLVNGVVDAGAYEYFSSSSPTLNPISSTTMTVGESLMISISASDPNNLSLTITASNVPAFGAFTDLGDGTATLQLDPMTGTEGDFNDIKIEANNGDLSVFELFDLTVLAVDANQAPVLEIIADQELEEEAIVSITLNAMDADGDDLSFSSTNLPSFATLTDHADGTATLVLNPKLGDAAIYSNIVITVTDGVGTDVQAFTVKVLTKDLPLSVDRTEDRVSIYPNPTVDGFFHIKLSDEFDRSKISLSIFNISGRVILNNGSLIQVSTNKYQLENRKRLSVGHYILKVTDGRQAAIKHLIVK